MWKIGDVCYLVTNKKKKAVTAYEVLRQREDGYFTVRILGGKTAVAASAGRMYASRSEALSSLSE